MDSWPLNLSLEWKDLLDLEEVKRDEQAFRCAKKLKDWCTIERNLREAEMMCRWAIEVHKSLSIVPAQTPLPKQLDRELRLSSIGLAYAIVIYSRWFKHTEGKTDLKPEDYFGAGSPELQVHDYVITLRDKYIVHNERDMLGKDILWVNLKGEDGIPRIDSVYKEEYLTTANDLDKDLFLKCIRLVHNCIKTVTIPEKTMNLRNRLKQLVSEATPAGRHEDLAAGNTHGEAGNGSQL